MSGGPDSMAMLLLARDVLDDFEVATVDHGLRAEAARECRLVADLCAKLAVPCTVLEVRVDEGNLQQEARRARYAALGEWAGSRDLAAVLTAHHADDQAETLLMRLNRGSGLAGLAGIRPKGRVEGCDVDILRPLLGFRRAELRAIVEQAGIEVADDPSNADQAFERVRIRQALAQADWIDTAGIAQSAALLADAEEFLAAQLSESFDTLCGNDGERWWFYPGASRFENIEMLAVLFARMGANPARSELDRLVDRLEDGKGANLSGILVRPVTDPSDLGIDVVRWNLEPEPPRRAG
ncbi:tRNA lysidine(34) synthetase TilS [Qipengyuania sp. XHP0207]|uniref:tRNA lysidine(34) synthetase TilS n=1 Tax=Qipengyuania sp. XHP0207 TaxID=3038078 RepID=UPI0024204EB7|nr:tRNA lysidine(34) synthetase TilS [Qipengyuania sp. XHP0207]MDG5749198.1 tRNA lysidine(34) synthetase TilS [Qipengyuania sp. XHP0207]